MAQVDHAGPSSSPGISDDPTTDAGNTPKVSARGVTKTYPGKDGEVVALNDVSLDIEQGEMAVLLGPSGCGKTTLLRSIAGLERPQAGEITIDGRTVYSAAGRQYVQPEQRAVSMVFQSYALWPHMTVFENIAFPLTSRRVPKAEVKQRVDAITQAVHLGPYGERLPSQLSGGQQQRVALARAIVADVDVILFDEPLSNVDARVREEIRKQIVELQAQYEFAGLYVTHDQVEAGAIATKLVVMNHGEIAQVGKPQDLYDLPKSQYVASFMGTTTEIQGRARPVDQLAVLESPFGRVVGRPSGQLADGDEAVAIFRPEWARLGTDVADAAENCWPCRVRMKSFMGSHMEVVVDVQGADGSTIEGVVTVPRGTGFRNGEDYTLHVPPEEMVIVPGGTS